MHLLFPLLSFLNFYPYPLLLLVLLPSFLTCPPILFLLVLLPSFLTCPSPFIWLAFSLLFSIVHNSKHFYYPPFHPSFLVFNSFSLFFAFFGTGFQFPVSPQLVLVRISFLYCSFLRLSFLVLFFFVFVFFFLFLFFVRLTVRINLS